MTARELGEMLLSLPQHQQGYPVAFIRGREFITVTYAVADELPDAATYPPLILLISGQPIGHASPQTGYSIGDRGK